MELEELLNFAELVGLDEEDMMFLVDAYEEEELGFILDCEEDDYE